MLAAETCRRQLADVPAVHEDRLASPGKCAGIVEAEEHEPLARVFRLLPLQRFATDERRGLVQLDRVTQARFPRRFVRTELGAPGAPTCLSIQSASRVACAEPVRMKNVSAPRRVMVRSLSNPPRSLSIAVYTIRPIGTSISLAHSRCSTVSASRPLRTNLAKEVWSNTTTSSRHARCSSST